MLYFFLEVSSCLYIENRYIGGNLLVEYLFWYFGTIFI